MGQAGDGPESSALQHAGAAPPTSCPSATVETLPAVVRHWRELGVPLLLELLGGVRAAVEGGGHQSGASGSPGGGGGRAYAQQLFVQAQCFVQICNCLNEEFPEVTGGLLDGGLWARTPVAHSGPCCYLWMYSQL